MVMGSAISQHNTPITQSSVEVIIRIDANICDNFISFDESEKKMVGKIGVVASISILLAVDLVE
jgi:hypothetical protein